MLTMKGTRRTSRGQVRYVVIGFSTLAAKGRQRPKPIGCSEPGTLKETLLRLLFTFRIDFTLFDMVQAKHELSF